MFFILHLQEVIGRVFLEMDLKRIALEEMEKGEAEEVEDNRMNIRPTERLYFSIALA